jgi:Na+/proline symporter
MLVRLTPGGWAAIVADGRAAGKLQFISWSWDLSVPFTFWGGLIGGCFLTMASHGTDQLLVQRLLTCRNKRESQYALVLSGFIVFLQFALFLTIGMMLHAYYASGTMAPLTGACPPCDEVFPQFIVRNLPHGIAGLVIAAIFAAAMSNLSGSLNSLASTSILDFYQPLAGARVDEQKLLKLSRWLTAAWGLVLIAIAIMARGWGSVFTVGLTIASIVYGPMLGAFLLGVLTKRTTERGVMAGIGVSLIAMIGVRVFTPLAWTWYVLVGTIICMTTGLVVSRVSR